MAVTLEGVISFASPSLTTLVGYDPQVLIGRCDGRLRPPRRPRRGGSACSTPGGRGRAPVPVQPIRVKVASGEWVPMSVDGVAGPEVAPFGAAVVTLRLVDGQPEAERSSGAGSSTRSGWSAWRRPS